MKNICKNLEKPIIIRNVSDLNRCYKNITYEKNDIVKSTELYIQDNSTFVPLSVQWAKFLNPGIFGVWFLYFKEYILAYGRCLFVQNIVDLHEKDFIKLNLNMDLTFIILFHDPDFFFLTQNPQGTTEEGLSVQMQELLQEDKIPRHTFP